MPTTPQERRPPYRVIFAALILWMAAALILGMSVPVFWIGGLALTAAIWLTQRR